MSYHDELRRISAWNRELVRENSRLQALTTKQEATIAELLVERESAGTLFGAAMDDALAARAR